jgi:mRNA interferase MazF
VGVLTAGRLAAGQIVILPFPFTDLSRDKLRPTLILSKSGPEDWVVCQITTNGYADPQAMLLDRSAFALGGLAQTSYLRPSKLFTAHYTLVAGRPASLTPAALEAARKAVVAAIYDL